MKNTNYFVGIVKILAISGQFSIENQIQAKQLYVEVPQKRNSNILSLLAWGNLGRDIEKFYHVNDYVIVEGYTSIQLKKNIKSRFISSNPKEVFITVTKIYPIVV